MDRFPYQQVGAWPSDAGWQFRCWAPRAEQLELVIQGPKAGVWPMQAAGYGYWECTVVDLDASSQYAYRINGGQHLYPDPASRHQPAGVHGPSGLVQLPPASSEGWRGRVLADMVIYELHIGTFTPAGTFAAAVEQLDELVDLGINTVELMPLAQFPGTRNWGYDGVCPFAVVDSYGGSQGMRDFVDACHQRSLAVLVDVVYNHLGPEGNYLAKFGPYFTKHHHTPWGRAINMDDAEADGVRNYFLQNALMWLRDYGADGLRLDAIHAIKDYSAQHFLAQLSDTVHELSQQTGRDYVLLGECDLNAPRYLQPTRGGGYGLQGQWVDEFHHALHAYLTGEQRGYYEDFGSIDHIAKALADGYVYTGEYSEHRQRNFGQSARDHGVQPGQLVVFLQNHDQVGNRPAGDRLLASLGRDKYLLGAGTCLLSPYVPLLFMGEEYGEPQPFQYFVSHGDAGLIEAVRQGRAREFAAFQGNNRVVPDPQSEQTFADSKLSRRKDTAILDFYRACLTLRHTYRRPAGQRWEQVSVEQPQPGLLRWSLSVEARVEVWANFTHAAVDLTEQPQQILLTSFAEPPSDGAFVLPPWGLAVVQL